LTKEAETLGSQGRLAEAADHLTRYAGRFREETAERRRELAGQWQRRAEDAARMAAAEAAKAESLREERVRRLGEAMLSGRVRQALAEAQGEDHGAVPESLATVLTALAGAHEALVTSLKAEVGKAIVLSTADGQAEVRLVGVSEASLQIEQKMGKATVRRHVPFLALGRQEILRRSGLTGDAAAVFLAIQAVKEKRYVEARRRLRGCGPELKEPMLAALAGISGEAEDRPSPPEGPAAAPPTLSGRENAPQPAIATPPPDDLMALQAALRRANPDYDGGGRIMTDPNGAIVEVLLGGCRGIRDLSPLAGLPLRFAELFDTEISDLSPLAGMPLHGLNLDRCRRVADLAPLAGMRSLRTLNAHATGVADIRPLAGLALVSLNLDGTGVRDLSPLRGMPLRELRLEDCPVDDYAVLAELGGLERLMPPALWRHVPGGPPPGNGSQMPPPRHPARRQPHP